MRKILCIILIISLLSFNIYSYAENETINQEENQQHNENKSIEDFQNESQELNNQINEQVDRLQIVQEELTENLLQVQEIDSKIQVSEEEIKKLNEEIEQLNRKISENEQILEIRQNQYNKAKKQADDALIAMYESGEVQYLEVLLGAKSVFEFISNYYLITELCTYNISLVEDADSKRQEIQEISDNLETEKQQILEKKKQQQKTTQILENTKTAKAYYKSKLTEEEQKIQSEIDEYRTQMAQIENEIRRLSGKLAFGENYVGEQMIWPIPGHTFITSQYGMRTHPITGLYSLHTGTDVRATTGTDFVSAASGVVTKAEYNKYYGNMVIIDHGGGVQTLYAHGSEIVAKLGQLIAQGETVLKVGSTGYSTGPHAHFEIRINGKTVNPLDYITPE